jgi:hypothetical protein
MSTKAILPSRSNVRVRQGPTLPHLIGLYFASLLRITYLFLQSVPQTGAILVRGLGDTERFDRFFSLWSITLTSLTMAFVPCPGSSGEAGYP